MWAPAAVLLLLLGMGPCARAEGRDPYDRIDAYALAAPDSAEESVPALAAYLTKTAKSDREKARALFRWIAGNVDYDTAGYRTGTYGDLSPDGVLKRRSAVCSGYAGLFERLAAAAGLEAVTIRGYSKGYGFTAGARLEGPTNHAWNAVKLDGKWHLLDCTWGAGHVTQAMEFERDFTEHYFLTPPDQFLYDHFPEDPKWQLLDRPISKEEYERLVYLRPGFFRCGLAVESHPAATIQAGDSATITFRGGEDALLLSTLMQDGEKLDRPLTLTQREEGKLVTRVRFPKPGEYTLRFFARPRNQTGPYKWALDYKVVATRGAGEAAEFPKTYGEFQERGAVLFSPMARRLESGSAASFALQVPGAEAVSVVAGTKWISLQRSGDRFEGKATPAAGAAQVCARFPGRQGYAVLLEYEAK